MSGEIMAGVLVGLGMAVCIGCLMVASGALPPSVVMRVARRLAPRDRRASSREARSPAFDCYYHRQRELETLFSRHLDAQRAAYPDHQLVVGVHRWEVALILDMPQVHGGRLYGEYELVRWDAQDCDIVPLHDRRLNRRAGGNGATGY